jgi:peptide/nickel transport system substrate-binding protein
MGTRTGRRARASAWLGAGVGLALMAVPAAASERLVIVMDPPVVDTNVLWLAGIGEPLPWMQSLVGNDPETGAYDNSHLARSWETNDDFTEWTFHLHEDAEFHFGWGPVTAHDVVHSYELHTSDEATYGGVELVRAREVEALDDHTVVFRFDTPRTNYAFYHAGRVEMLIYSKAQYEAEGLEGYLNKPAGTGPWQFVERVPAQRVVFERVEDHWQGIVPDFETVEFRWAAEPATKLALLLTGEAHIADLPREIQVDALAQGMKIVASRMPAMQTGAIFNGLYTRSDDPAHRPDLPWADIRVREAMNRAIDREQALEILYEGRANPLVRWGMDPRHEGYVPELEERFEAMYGYDPERAKALLAEAGYPEAFPDPTIPIVSSVLAGNPEFGAMAELLQVFFDEIGLQTEIREIDWASLGALGRGRQAYLIAPIRNAPIRPSETALDLFFTTGGAPYGGYESDTIEALVAKLRNTLDPEERDQVAAEAFTYLFEQYADMPLAEVHAEVVVNPEVVDDWTFPGVTTNSVSHWHLITAAQ